jgi:hypothetical protein
VKSLYGSAACFLHAGQEHSAAPANFHRTWTKPW